MIKIDGVEYKATWLQGLKQSAEILNGEGTGRLQGTGEMYIEPLGTFLNHAGTLHKDSDCTESEWSNLFLVLCNPNNKHAVNFPFGVNSNIEQDVYISRVERTLKLIKETNKWERVIEVSFIATKAFWGQNGRIEGIG